MGSWFGDTSSTTTSSMAPWLEPYAQSYIGNAANLASQQQPMYMGQRVAPMNAQYGQAIDLVTQRAISGAPDLNAGRGAAMNIAQGGAQNNPWLGPDYTNQVIGQNANLMADAAARGSMAQTDSAFAQAGAFGGSAYQQQQALNQGELAKQVGAMGSQYQLANQQMGANDYRSGVNQQLQAGSLAGQLSQDDWTAGAQLAGAGDIQRNYQQQLLDQSYNTWQGQQQYPYQQLRFFGNALGVPGGGTTTQTQPGQSLWPNLIGAGLIGAGLLGGG